MTDIEKARDLFSQAGLAFPKIPEGLAVHLEEKERWLFSTRKRELGHDTYRHPYWLASYVDEVAKGDIEDYAVLAHGGHGVNSYAIQYYLVYANLRLFLHLGWGGAYMDSQEATDQVRECFALADEIVAGVKAGVEPQTSRTLTIVCSDFYGSYWHVGRDTPSGHDDDLRRPVDVLTEALLWVNSQGS
jgi:hypothetical protein